MSLSWNGCFKCRRSVSSKKDSSQFPFSLRLPMPSQSIIYLIGQCLLIWPTVFPFHLLFKWDMLRLVHFRLQNIGGFIFYFCQKMFMGFLDCFLLWLKVSNCWVAPWYLTLRGKTLTDLAVLYHLLEITLSIICKRFKDNLMKINEGVVDELGRQSYPVYVLVGGRRNT